MSGVVDLNHLGICWVEMRTSVRVGAVENQDGSVNVMYSPVEKLYGLTVWP